jgi:hypothetical protein
MQSQSQGRRCDLRDVLADLLDFMEEQIKGAVENPDDQLAAVDAASGVIPLMRDRLYAKAGTPEDEVLTHLAPEDRILPTQFLFVLGNAFESGWWREWWDRLAKLQPWEFREEATSLLESIAELKTVVAESFASE